MSGPAIYCTGGCDACRDAARELGVELIVPAAPPSPEPTPGLRDRMEQMLRQRARGGEGLGFNADMHEEAVVAAILSDPTIRAALAASPAPEPTGLDAERLRHLLWSACPHVGKYGDDGEMQCRGEDFRRAEITVLMDHLSDALFDASLYAARLTGEAS